MFVHTTHSHSHSLYVYICVGQENELARREAAGAVQRVRRRGGALRRPRLVPRHEVQLLQGVPHASAKVGSRCGRGEGKRGRVCFCHYF
jgi:hypothetical protein